MIDQFKIIQQLVVMFNGDQTIITNDLKARIVINKVDQLTNKLQIYEHQKVGWRDLLIDTY